MAKRKTARGSKKKRGRPPLSKAERRSKNVVFRLDPTELTALERKASEDGVSKSEILRRAIRKFLGLSKPPDR